MLACAVLLWALAALQATAGEAAGDATEYTLTSWTTRDGLPSSYLLSIAQDRDGYLWAGTNAGVVKFDGQRFSPWPRTGAFPVPSTLINAVFATSDGTLWIVAGNSIVRENGGQVTVVPPVDGVSQITRTSARVPGGAIWAAGSRGLARLEGDRWQSVEVPGEPGAAVTALHEDQRQRLWIATGGRIYRQDHGRFVHVPVEVDGPVRFIERDGVMYVGALASDFQVFRLHDTAPATRVVTLPLADVQEPGEWSRASWRASTPWLLDSRGHVWLGTNGAGLVRIDLASGRVLRRYTERDGLSGDMVCAVIEDRDGNIWAATHSGLTRVTPSSIRSVPVRAGSTADDISTLEQDAEGGVWVEAPGALVRLTTTTSARFTTGAGAAFDRITAMHTDACGVFWVAAAERRLVRWVGRRFEPVPLPESFAAHAVTSIASGADGRLWLYNGREILVQAPDGTETVVTPAGVTDGLVRFTYADRRGRLWIAADHAEIAIIDGPDVRMLGAAEGVPAGNLTGIREDASGRIWMSSDSGLSAIDGASVRTLTAANGIPGRRVFFVTDDAGARLWLGTTSGLARVEKAELDHALADPHYRIRLQLFDVFDGLRGTPVVRGYPTAARSRDRIWFVSSTGVATIDPGQVREALPPPVPRIEQVLVDGQSFDPASGERLPSGMASLQIEHAALNLTAPTKVRFRHRLEGVDPDWVDDGGDTRTVYAHLPNGTYRFVVAASAGDGRWSDAAAVWTFVVPPRWYQSRVFYGAAVALLVLGVWAAWRLRLRQVHRRFTDVLGERARVAREIHDTLLQSLVGMALQLDTVAHTEEPTGLREEVGRIRRQVQDAIGEAQRSIRDLRAPRAEVRDLVTRLRESAGPMLEHAGITFELVVTGTPRPLKAAVEQQLMRIGMEAVVNAMRHAQAAHVRMELAFERATVRLRVTDDGHGFNPDAVKADTSVHWGLSIMRERAEQVGGRSSIMSTPEGGTSVEVTAPGGAPA